MRITVLAQSVAIAEMASFLASSDWLDCWTVRARAAMPMRIMSVKSIVFLAEPSSSVPVLVLVFVSTTSPMMNEA